MQTPMDSEQRQRRHDTIYATPGLPAFNCDWVADRVLAGRNPLTCRDVERLQAEGITHILDLREPEEWAAPKFGLEAVEEIERCGLKRLNRTVRDQGLPVPGALDEACRFIDEALADPEARVYVHCRGGIERTAVVLVAWYASRKGLSYDEAYRQLHRRRPDLIPLGKQAAAVRHWLDERTAGLAAPARGG